MRWILGLFLLGAAAPGDLAAQVQPAADSPTAEEQATGEKSEDSAPATAPAGPPDYFFPDLPAPTLVYNGRYFLFKPIFAMVGDFTAFDQDDASLAQVGEQEDEQEVRAARLGFYLRSKGRLAVGLLRHRRLSGAQHAREGRLPDLRHEGRHPARAGEADDRQAEGAVLLRADRALRDPAPPGAHPLALLRHPQHRRPALGPPGRRSDDVGGGGVQRLAGHRPRAGRRTAPTTSGG